MRSITHIALPLAASLLTACIGGSHTTAALSTPAPTLNTLALTVDTGPAAAPGAINHAYVTVKVCAAGSQTCATIDHVLLDTGSNGLRLVHSVLSGFGVTLNAETDAQGNAVEECLSFSGGQTWGPVALADVTLAGESAKVPVQVMDDTGVSAPPPATCGANGTLINAVSGFDANGVLGVGVFAQDCGAACVAAATPLPLYYGCTAAGVCTAENLPLTDQVTNPVAMFAADNNGIVIELPNLQNANGDATVQGTLIFGIATQTDNALPAAGLTVLGADANGDFTAVYNGGTTVLPALIDSGTDSYGFNDPTIAVCGSGAFVGYYCPAVAPLSVSAVNTGVGAYNSSSTIAFAIADPNTFVANAAAFIDLAGGGGATNFIWGMPFFYGRNVYIGIDQHVAGIYTGPYYAY
ncbi:MAG TPA: DUF3443 family protein [Steroidobacteraceae bacterium]|nr:DUF3443 family protein [Steroidobacteraceae bacterium]